MRRLSIASVSPQPVARLFGAPTIETADGRVGGRAVQRHRIALIALLASAKRGARSRDYVIDLLWPDTGGDRGRRLLSDSVYRINHAVGGDALAVRGDSVELSRTILDTDVGDFESALAERDWRRMIELHEAPFLDGFYLPGAVEFDQWMEAQRTRYEREVAKARDAQHADARGIAVLPFRFIGASDMLVDLVDILAEETSAALGRRTTIPVVSRLSSMAPSEAAIDVREVGRRLNAAWLLDGTVRQVGEALRIVARLTDAGTGYQTWTDSFEASVHGLIAAEVLVAEGIAAGIGERLRRVRETMAARSTALSNIG